MMECYLAFGQFEPAVREYEAEVTCKELRGALWSPRGPLSTAGCHNYVFQKRHMAVLIQSEQVKTSLC